MLSFSNSFRLLGLLMALVICLSTTDFAEAGLKKKGKALAVGGLAAAGAKNKGDKKEKVCPKPAAWPREFTNDGTGQFKAIGVVIASEQRQSKPEGCSHVHIRNSRDGSIVTAEIEFYQGSKLNVWMSAEDYDLKKFEEGNCVSLTIAKDENVYKDNYLDDLRSTTSCFTALYHTSPEHEAYFESKSYFYGSESPVPHNDPSWIADAKRGWGLLKVEQPALTTMLVAYEEFMNGEDLFGEIPAHSNNDFKKICENRFDKEAQSLGKRLETQIGFEKCARNQDNVVKLMRWYHPDYKDYSSTENWFDFDEGSPPVTSVWGEIARWNLQTNASWDTRAPSDVAKRAKRKYAVRVSIITAVRLANMIIAARLDPSVPTYYAAFLSGSFSSHLEWMSQTTERLFSVQSEREVLENIREYQLTPSILRSYQELLDDPADYDEVFSYYLENMDFATPSPEELYRKLYFRMATVEMCYEAKRGEVFVYMKSGQRDAARRGFNQAVKELDPPPNKDRVKAINAAYDEEMNSMVDTLRTADYMGDIREWCVDSANYLTSPALRAMYQEAGL